MNNNYMTQIKGNDMSLNMPDLSLNKTKIFLSENEKILENIENCYGELIVDENDNVIGVKRNDKDNYTDYEKVVYELAKNYSEYEIFVFSIKLQNGFIKYMKLQIENKNTKELEKKYNLLNEKYKRCSRVIFLISGGNTFILLCEILK